MTRSFSVLLGVAYGFAAALIGASWQVATRYGVTSSLAPSDLALLRYGIPALLLSPLLIRHGVLPRNVHRGWLIVLICSGGIGYGLLAMTGASLSPTAHMGVLVSGTMPLFTALLFLWVAREPINKRRQFGYALIIAGALAFGFASTRLSFDDSWIGDIFFVAAAMSWAVYTFAFRKLALPAWYATAIVCFWSVLAAVVWAALRGGTRLFSAPPSEIAIQMVMQGIVAGLLGSVAFFQSIRHLGANNAALFGALVPLLSALGGYALLSETVNLASAIAIAVLTLGILLAARWREPH